MWSAADSAGRAVAIKFLKSGLLSEVARRRFVAEQQVLGALDHPAIAKMLDAGVTGAGVPYLVLELIDGCDVIAFCNKHELDLGARVRLTIQALRGLAVAHAHGVVHRDIKPSNLLVTGDAATPRLRIIDFGIAKFDGVRGTASASLTATGQAMGTTNYMSPEQIAEGAKDIDAASDLYSVAVVLYELLTGHLPYDQQLLDRSPRDAIRESLPLSCQRWGTSVPPAIESVIARGLRKEPSLRFSTAGALADALESCLAGQTPESVWGRRRYATRHFAKRYWLPLSAAALLLMGMATATAVSTRWALIAERERDAAEFSTYRTTLASVNKALEVGDFVGARTLLADAPQSQRGLEWSWFATMAAGGQELWSEGEAIRTLAAADDGWWVGLMSGELLRLDVTGRVRWRVADAASPLSALAARQADATGEGEIVSGHADGSMIARRIAVPDEQLWRLSLGSAVLGAFACPDGWIAVTNKAVVRIDDQGHVHHQQTSLEDVTAVTVGSDATTLFLGGGDGRVRRVRWQEGQWTTSWTTAATHSPVAAVAFAPGARGKGSSIWVAWMRGDLQELLVEDGSPTGGITPRRPVVSLAVEPVTGMVAMGTRDGMIGMFADATATESSLARDHEGMARVAFRMGELATAGWDGRIRIRPVRPSTLAHAGDPPGQLSAVSWDANGRGCAAWRSSRNPVDLVIRMEDAEPITVSLISPVLSLARGRDGWLVGTRDGAVHIVEDVATVTRLHEPDGIPCMAVTQDVNHILWKTSQDGTCYRMTQGKFTLVASPKLGTFVGAAAALGRDEGIAVTGTDGIVHAVAPSGVRRLANFREQVAHITTSDHGGWAAITSDARRLSWSTELGSSIKTVNVESPATAGPVWTRDFRRLAIGHTSGRVRVVDCRQALDVAYVPLSDVAIRALAIDDDGRLIALDDAGVIRSIRAR